MNRVSIFLAGTCTALLVLLIYTWYQRTALQTKLDGLQQSSGATGTAQPDIASLLSHPDQSVRRLTVELLGHLGGDEAEKALPNLATGQLPDGLDASSVTSEQREELQLIAIEALQRLSEQPDHSADYTDLLIGLLKNDSHRIRRKAAWTLGKSRATKAAGPIIEALKAEKSNIKAGNQMLVEGPYLEALTAIGDPKAAPVFVERLKSKDRLIRRAAATGLGKTGNKSHRAILLKSHQREKDQFVRRELRKALESPRIGLKWDIAKHQFIDPATDKPYQPAAKAGTKK